MTNPSNAVKKPATGCGCGHVGSRCQEALRLHHAVVSADIRLGRAEDEIEAANAEFDRAEDAYRAHVGASNG